MAIYLNGGANPQSVTFNGVSLNSVWASTDGGITTRQVWGQSSTVPRTIGQMTGTKGSGLQVWIRDSTLVRAWRELWTSDQSLHLFAEYACDITLEVDYPAREFVGGAYGDLTDIQYAPSTTSGTTSITGLPSGYTFNSLTPSYVKNLDFYKTVSHQDMTIDTTLHIDCNLSLSTGYMFILGDTGLPGNYYLFTATSGFIYQNSAVLRIEKTS